MTARRFAADTEVPVEKTREELMRLLRQHDADGLGYGSDEKTGRDVLFFRLDERQVRFFVERPRWQDHRETATGRARADIDAERAADKEYRRRWRLLLLAVKAKLELVAGGVTTVEEEFLAHVVTPSGATVGQWLRPQLARAYETGKMPPLLPGASHA